MCGSGIPEAAVLIEYESRGDSAVYAECPDCFEVVHPI